MVLTNYDRNRELTDFDDTKAGVKGLLEQGIQKIPQIFVNEQYILEKTTNNNSNGNRSKFTTPIIDLGCLKLNSDRARIIDQVKDACEKWGFFQIENRGIAPRLMNRVLDGVREFHELDAEVKKLYYSRDFMKKVVYNSNFDLHQAKRANWRDTLYLIMAPDPPLPQELPQVCRNNLTWKLVW